MKLRPLEYYVVVEPIAVEEKTKGGLFIPDQVRERDEFARTEGTLAAVSPAAFKALEGWPEGEPVPQVGDRVMFSKYSATEFKDNGKTYWLMRDRNVIAQVKE